MVCVNKALGGDMAAVREIADRLDGKPRQEVGIGGTEDEKPIVVIKQMVDTSGKPVPTEEPWDSPSASRH
jgi:hypothetical protein